MNCNVNIIRCHYSIFYFDMYFHVWLYRYYCYLVSPWIFVSLFLKSPSLYILSENLKSLFQIVNSIYKEYFQQFSNSPYIYFHLDCFQFHNQDNYITLNVFADRPQQPLWNHSLQCQQSIIFLSIRKDFMFTFFTAMLSIMGNVGVIGWCS